MKKSYVMVNKNRTINLIKESDDIENIFHEILVHIDDVLEIMANNKLVIGSTKLNFDNYLCVEKLSNNYVSNIVRFDVDGLCWRDVNDNIVPYSPSLELSISSIKNKMSRLSNSKKNNMRITSNMRAELLPGNMGNGACDNSTSANKQPPKNVDNDAYDNLTPEELKKLIDVLEESKKKEVNRLDSIRKINSDNKENLSSWCAEFDDKKRNHSRQIEKLRENKNRFCANRDAYFKIKEDISDNKLSEDNISELFIDEYPIFKFMDESNIINADDAFQIFTSLREELCSPPDNQKCDDMVENFITKSNNGKYPPLEDILKLL